MIVGEKVNNGKTTAYTSQGIAFTMIYILAYCSEKAY